MRVVNGSEIEERSVLEIRVPISNSNTTEKYTAQLVDTTIRLEGPYDEGYVEIPLDVFHTIVKWVNRKITEEHESQ